MGKAHDTVYQRGREAFWNGVPIEKCPYAAEAAKRHGRNYNVVSGATGYAQAWERGWTEAKKKAELSEDER